MPLNLRPFNCSGSSFGNSLTSFKLFVILLEKELISLAFNDLVHPLVWKVLLKSNSKTLKLHPKSMKKIGPNEKLINYKTIRNFYAFMYSLINEKKMLFIFMANFVEIGFW